MKLYLINPSNQLTLVMYPKDWKYYTLTFPVVRYKNLSLEQIIDEMVSCDHAFYSIPRIIGRI
ncbi:MAG: hypothetical protein GX654_06320 [Desulfatiglans sp.]|nr:hypothetical protein [Desulfatiglans sp.]